MNCAKKDSVPERDQFDSHEEKKEFDKYDHFELDARPEEHGNQTNIKLESSVSVKSDAKTNKKDSDRSINEHFHQRMFSKMINDSNKKRKEKYKSYHARLLEKYLESGRSRGKMSKMVEYDAYNSDEDSSDYSDTFEQSLFYRYGLASHFVDGNIKLPNWSNKKSR